MYEIETDLKHRVLELRMRAADLKAMLTDTASLADDAAYFYAEELSAAQLEAEPLDRACERAGIVEVMRQSAEALAEVLDDLVNLTRLGAPLATRTITDEQQQEEAMRASKRG